MFPVLPLLLALAQTGAVGPLDQTGNFLQPSLSSSAAGTILNSYAVSTTANYGIARNGTTLCYANFNDGLPLIYLVDEATGVSMGTVTTTNSNDAGLGYDSTRNLYIVTDPVQDIVLTFDANGGLVNQWASPSLGPVGAAYDSTRDVYWISDWWTDTISSIDPTTGAVITTWSMAALGCTRTTGAAYDAVNDQITVGGRDQTSAFVVDAATGALVRSFPVQGGTTNDPQGISDSSSGNIWHSTWTGNMFYELDLGNGGGGGLALSMTGTCPGVMNISVTGATAAGSVALAYGNAGSFTLPSGSCAGLVLDIANPTLAAFFTADSAGSVAISPNIPGAVCGLTLQAVDMATCSKSNAVIL